MRAKQIILENQDRGDRKIILLRLLDQSTEDLDSLIRRAQQRGDVSMSDRNDMLVDVTETIMGRITEFTSLAPDEEMWLYYKIEGMVNQLGGFTDNEL